MKKIIKKILIYIRPFCKWQFLISYFIPFMIVNGWAWIGFFLSPIIGLNWFTISATTWLAILWLPCTPEKLITIPLALWIHTKLFGKKGKTHYQLVRMYAEAKKDWENIKAKFRRIKMDKIKELWENDGWEFKEESGSFHVSKTDGIFTKYIKINIEYKRFYPYFFAENKDNTYENIKPVWIDENIFKLLRKTARLLKWKI